MINFLTKKNVKTLIRHHLKLVSVFAAALVVIAAYPKQFVKAVEIHDGFGGRTTKYTFMNATDAILEDADIKISENDNITVTSGDSNDLTIKIERAFKVYVEAYGSYRAIEATSGTVADALKGLGYTVDENDVVNPSLDTKLEENMYISYTNIDITTETDIETEEFKTVKTVNFNMKEGSKKTLCAGVNGITSVETKTTYVNGVEVKNEVNRKVLQETVNKKVEVGGTQVKANKSGWVSELKCDRNIMLDKNGVPTKYKKVLKGVASAYCTGTTCSTGVSVKPGYIAVDPSIIPYGTEMYIRTPDGGYIYGYAVAADTGGFIYWGNTIADLYVNTYSEAINFGRRNIEIYILD